MKYEEHVMKRLRQREGLEADDTSKDLYLQQLSSAEVFNEVLTWEGMPGYATTLVRWIEDIYDVDLEDKAGRRKSKMTVSRTLVTVMMEVLLFFADSNGNAWDSDLKRFVPTSNIKNGLLCQRNVPETDQKLYLFVLSVVDEGVPKSMRVRHDCTYKADCDVNDFIALVRERM